MTSQHTQPAGSMPGLQSAGAQGEVASNLPQPQPGAFILSTLSDAAVVEPADEGVAAPVDSAGSDVMRLSGTELAILQGRSNGLCLKRISPKVHKSLQGLKSASKTLQRKLGAKSMYQAVAIAIRRGIIQ